MIDQKLAIITTHDVNPSHSEKILQTLGEINKLRVKYNLSIVPYYNKKYNLKDRKVTIPKLIQEKYPNIKLNI